MSHPARDYTSRLRRTPARLDPVVSPFRAFFDSTVSGGLLLMAAAIVAIVWANSAWASDYIHLWETDVSIGFGSAELSMSLHHWINDGLMAVFFLVVGVEIKRELLIGELNTPRKATLPIAAAMGGAILPAIIYALIVGGGLGQSGWGIPMATDIAFALGVLALLGSRVPVGLRVFLTALAIVDDLLAVVVIAVFYTHDLQVEMLLGAAVVLGVLALANWMGVRHPVVYGALGLVLWLFVLKSGVHATVAGVLLAITIPARVRIDAPAFVQQARHILDRFDRVVVQDPEVGVEEDHEDLWELETITQHAQAPMLRLEHTLHPWVAFLIVPLFALANAGVPLGTGVLGFPPDPIILGVLLGLIVGKQVGITTATWLVVRSGRAVLPEGVGWRHIYGVGWLGGIGFTMSLFIAELALHPGAELAMAKVGILGASVIAGIAGYCLLRWWAPKGHVAEPGPPAAAPSAPASTGAGAPAA
ncbi:MAG: Na+/H+ antiporter NhaA [Chloroflexota bacterium]